jgi:hypothetical protein
MTDPRLVTDADAEAIGASFSIDTPISYKYARRCAFRLLSTRAALMEKASAVVGLTRVDPREPGWEKVEAASLAELSALLAELHRKEKK